MSLRRSTGECRHAAITARAQRQTGDSAVRLSTPFHQQSPSLFRIRVRCCSRKRVSGF
ncbi:hypothetical protein C8T65DRAFT_645862, partial [Cerioporus squamosus]